MTDTVTRTMGCSHKEFHHSIRSLLEGREWERLDEGYRLREGNGWVLIMPGPETVQRIASLHLPRTPVYLSFQGVDHEQRSSFLRRFDIAFQRGGG